jgi:hypothetical protein
MNTASDTFGPVVTVEIIPAAQVKFLKRLAALHASGRRMFPPSALVTPEIAACKAAARDRDAIFARMTPAQVIAARAACSALSGDAEIAELGHRLDLLIRFPVRK